MFIAWIRRIRRIRQTCWMFFLVKFLTQGPAFLRDPTSVVAVLCPHLGSKQAMKISRAPVRSPCAPCFFELTSWCFKMRCLSMSFPELITCCLLSCCLLESSHPMLLYLNSSLYPNSAFGLWKRIFWQATILACPSRYGCLLIRRMAVLEGAFEKCGNLRIYGRSSWECFKKASRLRVQRVDMLAMLANPWPIVKLAGFAWKPHRSTALTRRRWWLW